jgi:hypothetical protein
MADILFNLPNFSEDRKFYRSFQKTLEDVTYTFTVQFLSRPDRFILSIGEAARGITVQNGVDMIQQLHHLAVPPGELRLFDFDGLNRDPTRNTFGGRITFNYTESNGT